jgi:hypothetical protein
LLLAINLNCTALTVLRNRDTDGRPYSYTYHHFADARHATEAITGSAEEYIHQHVQRKQEGEGKRPMPRTKCPLHLRRW